MTAAAGIETLCSDLLEAGFGRLRVSGDIAQRIETVYARAKDFFNLPFADKRLYQLHDDSGFRPFGVEYSQSPDEPDPIESFAATARLPLNGVPHHPAAAHALYREMLLAIDALERLAEPFVIALASAVSGADQAAKLTGSLRRWSSLQVNRALPDAAVRPLHQLHEDGHLLTFAFANAPGLEIRRPDGALRPVAAEANWATVMPGEIASLLSGGLVRPLFHRVMRHPHAPDRMAILYFVDIDPLVCRPWRLGAANAGVDIGQHVLTNAARFGRKPFDPE